MLALRILAVIALQTAVLGQMIYERAQILMNGAIVTLKTVPIDPRDLFRGYYVVLSYDINWLDVTKLEGDNRFVPREEVFVALEERDGFWSATAIYHRWPTTLGNQVVIGGQVQSVNERRVPCPEDESDCTYESQPLEAVTVEIDYRIDSYFVPEGEGKKIERAIGDRGEDGRVRVAVEAAVDRKDGTAAIKALILDGKRLYEERIF